MRQMTRTFLRAMRAVRVAWLWAEDNGLILLILAVATIVGVVGLLAFGSN